jgi:hypothetical protein
LHIPVLLAARAPGSADAVEATDRAGVDYIATKVDGLTSTEDASSRSAGITINAYSVTIPAGAMRTFSRPLMLRFVDITSGFRAYSQPGSYELKTTTE